MKVNRWDFIKHAYDIIEIPTDWYVTTSGELGETINCIHCGKRVLVDNCYTSYRYQDSIGLGYLICGECMENEFKVRQRYQNEQEP